MRYLRACQIIPAAIFAGLLALGSCLSSCVGTDSCISPEEKAAEDTFKCQQYGGFAPGTEAYAACRKQLTEGKESAVSELQSNE
jgi:hypothetical protein